MPTLAAPKVEVMTDRVANTRLYRNWAVPGLNDPDLIPLDIGMDVLGGLAYGLARLSTLLDDPGIRRWATTAVDLAAGAPDRPGWADGSAGCLAAMSAVHTELGLESADRLAAEAQPVLLDVPIHQGFEQGAIGRRQRK